MLARPGLDRGLLVTAHDVVAGAPERGCAGTGRAGTCATTPSGQPPPEARRTGRIPDRTRARHADVHRPLAEGRSYRQVAAGLGLSRNTVRRFARAASPDELLASDGTGRQPSILDEHAAYLAERWNAGCTNAARLHQEFRDRGYRGEPSYIRQYLARYRGATTAPAPVSAPPKVREVTAWIMTKPDRLTDDDKTGLDAILASSPELASVTASAASWNAGPSMCPRQTPMTEASLSHDCACLPFSTVATRRC